ncbi:MAG: hypothetical protein Fur005_32830 [Roseiflexaceae bacterium]
MPIIWLFAGALSWLIYLLISRIKLPFLITTLVSAIGAMIGTFIVEFLYELVFGNQLYLKLDIIALFLSLISAIGSLHLFVWIGRRKNDPLSKIVALQSKTEKDSMLAVNNSPSLVMGEQRSKITPIPLLVPQPTLQTSRPRKLLSPSEEEEVSSIKDIISQYRRRLRALQRQEAIKGISADPSIGLEIEDISAKIEQLTRELENLEYGSP